MASPSPKRKVEVRFCWCCSAAAKDPGALMSPTPCFPLLPSRGQSAVGFLLEGSRLLGCPKRAPSTARLLSRGPWALIAGSDWIAVLGMGVWTGACYWNGVGGYKFNPSSPKPKREPAGHQGVAGGGYKTTPTIHNHHTAAMTAAADEPAWGRAHTRRAAVLRWRLKKMQSSIPSAPVPPK